MPNETRPTTDAEMAELRQLRQLLDEWLNALDRYPQAKEYLHTETGYCCLGVLCDVFYGPECWNETSGADHYAIIYGDDECTSMPPQSLLDMLGLNKRLEVTRAKFDQNEKDPDFAPPILAVQRLTIADYLANLNDSGLSFAFIRRVARMLLNL